VGATLIDIMTLVRQNRSDKKGTDRGRQKCLTMAVALLCPSQLP